MNAGGVWVGGGAIFVKASFSAASGGGIIGSDDPTRTNIAAIQGGFPDSVVMFDEHGSSYAIGSKLWDQTIGPGVSYISPF
jgi:hypothetical protein